MLYYQLQYYRGSPSHLVSTLSGLSSSFNIYHKSVEEFMSWNRENQHMLLQLVYQSPWIILILNDH